MMSAVRAAPPDQRLALIKGHPDLAGKAARAGTMTSESTAEQASVGLDRLSEAEFAAISSPQRRLPGKIRHPVHRLRAPAHQGFDSAAVRSAVCRTMRAAETEAALAKSSASPRFASISGLRPPIVSRCTAACRPMFSTPMRGRPAAACAVELGRIVRQWRARHDRARDHQSRRPHRRAADRRAAAARSRITNCASTSPTILRVWPRRKATRRSSIRCRCGSRSPSRRATITCRCW